MRKFILLLFLMVSINGMAIHVHHFHHYPKAHHHSHITTHQTKKVQPRKVHRIIRQHHTKLVNTYWRNGVLYYVILRPRKGHVYDNGLVLCESCNKVLVKKGVRYCSKCRKIKRTKLCPNGV